MFKRIIIIVDHKLLIKKVVLPIVRLYHKQRVLCRR